MDCGFAVVLPVEFEERPFPAAILVPDFVYRGKLLPE